MAKVIIGHAANDNDGICSGNYYKPGNHGPWKVFRPKDSTIRKKLVECMVKAIANREHIHYSMSSRNVELFNATKNSGFDPSTVKSGIVHTDCAALIYLCCRYAGVPNLGGQFYTGTQLNALTNSGAFSVYLNFDLDEAKLLTGDILLTRDGSGGHTCMIISTDGTTPSAMGSASSGGSEGGALDAVSSKMTLSATTTVSKIVGRAITLYQYSHDYKTLTVEYDRDLIQYADPQTRLSGTEFLSYPNLVETPFILVLVGNYTFGTYKEGTDTMRRYPNFIKSMTVTKINGKVNQYTISLVHKIEAGSDPNLVDKIISGVGIGGKVYITYGDYSEPTLTYKKEEAILLKCNSLVDFKGSSVLYTLQCTSNATVLYSRLCNFPAYESAKPSDIIKKMLWDSNDLYGLLLAFPGMANKNEVLKYISSDDLPVKIPAQTSMDPIAYLNMLVSYMNSTSNSADSMLKDSTYRFCMYDSTYETLEDSGSYFKIVKLTANEDNATLSTENTYTVDIGFPTSGNVLGFNITDDSSWALLYEYADNIRETVYNVNSSGVLTQEYIPKIMMSTKMREMTEYQRTWWTEMTEFKVRANLTLKGLSTPVRLMDYVRINAYFYGQKHIASGLYVITSQKDSISGGGYRTELGLLRIAGDNAYITNKTYAKTEKIPVLIATAKLVLNASVRSYKDIQISIKTEYYENSGSSIDGVEESNDVGMGTGAIAGCKYSDIVTAVKALYAAGATLEGACGMVGNLCAESSCNPKILEYLCCSRLKSGGLPDYKSEEGRNLYAASVNYGMGIAPVGRPNGLRKITKEQFLHPLQLYSPGSGSVFGYGLALWTSVGRKSKMYDYMKSKGKGIGDLVGQVEFLVKELLESFGGVWSTLKTTKSVNDASDIVLSRFEMPAVLNYDTRRLKSLAVYTYMKEKIRTDRSAASFFSR